jgi:hypothetical protein
MLVLGVMCRYSCDYTIFFRNLSSISKSRTPEERAEIVMESFYKLATAFPRVGADSAIRIVTC